MWYLPQFYTLNDSFLHESTCVFAPNIGHPNPWILFARCCPSAPGYVNQYFAAISESGTSGSLVPHHTSALPPNSDNSDWQAVCLLALVRQFRFRLFSKFVATVFWCSFVRLTSGVTHAWSFTPPASLRNSVNHRDAVHPPDIYSRCYSLGFSLLDLAIDRFEFCPVDWRSLGTLVMQNEIITCKLESISPRPVSSHLISILSAIFCDQKKMQATQFILCVKNGHAFVCVNSRAGSRAMQFRNHS